jgi:hypothetical protein
VIMSPALAWLMNHRDTENIQNFRLKDKESQQLIKIEKLIIARCNVIQGGPKRIYVFQTYIFSKLSIVAVCCGYRRNKCIV